MSTKHVFNSSEGLVLKALRGSVALNPSLRLHEPSKCVYNVYPSPNTKVAVISGGGAGHEPAHASYTGSGMLAASVSGDIFASPSAKQILTTIDLAMHTPPLPTSVGAEVSQRDVLIIINNYTGDRLNFGLAVEKSRSTYPKCQIASVVVADDVSLLDSAGLVGPRGLAGNILVCKILGAFAEMGAGLDEVKQMGDAVVNNLASVGVGLEHCHVPGRSVSPANGGLGANECEVGLGLHNEPGANKVGLDGAEELVRKMLALILESRKTVDGAGDFVRQDLTGRKDDVILFLNNLGGMSQLEMGALVEVVLAQLEKQGVYPLRIYCSSYMTSLNAPGFSISLLNTTRVNRQTNIPSISVLTLLDQPTEATAWVGGRVHWSESQESRLGTILATQETVPCAHGPSTDINGSSSYLDPANFEVWASAVKRACRGVLSVEAELTRFDTVVGDGDCGETFARGANAILKFLEMNKSSDTDASYTPSSFVFALSATLEDNMGGTIGALFAIFLASLSSALATSPSTIKWSPALSSALRSLSRHTPAKQGDRTIIDALVPFCDTLAKFDQLHRSGAFQQAVLAARDGALKTKTMKPKLGRATYVVTEGGDLPPDPGAWGFLAIVEAIAFE
ncbi:Dak1-domain-containing protein [Pluteus cervinus]|uniref:Dak1-domain-containing protein n=1 Tax=Pluteus cervinus TaxID=181527 RepID=A0ACD3B0M6_9AGAR|nr:Dak1-domain-containing protein [Pluteus cervinus]